MSCKGKIRSLNTRAYPCIITVLCTHNSTDELYIQLHIYTYCEEEFVLRDSLERPDEVRAEIKVVFQSSLYILRRIR